MSHVLSRLYGMQKVLMYPLCCGQIRHHFGVLLDIPGNYGCLEEKLLLKMSSHSFNCIGGIILMTVNPMNVFFGLTSQFNIVKRVGLIGIASQSLQKAGCKLNLVLPNVCGIPKELGCIWAR